MTREISIHDVNRAVLLNELRHVVAYFCDLGYETCELVFGWHWGMDYPLAAPWEAIHVPLAEVEVEVRKPEIAGLGEFGRDDVTVRFTPMGVEFCFCHHGGIHLTYSQPGPFAVDFLARWALAELAPVERDCESSH